MSDDFQIGHMTNGHMCHLAQSDPGPFDDNPPLRSFWHGQLVQRLNIRGPVSKMDFMAMANFKRPADLLTQDAIDHFRRTPNNEFLSGGWGIQVPQPENFEEFVARDHRLVEAAEASLRATFAQVFEPKIHAVIPGKRPPKTGIGAFCAFVYSDKSLCFLFDVTVTENMERSYPIDEKLLLGEVSPGWEVQ